MRDTQKIQILHRSGKAAFTLTEIAIVLGIIGLILGAIWVAASAVYNNQRVTRANTEILQIAQGVRALYATSANTGGVAANMTDGLVCAKAVPGDMIAAACGTPATLRNPWPTGTTAIYTPASGDSFTIEMTAVPRSACISLLVAVGGSGRDPGLFNATGTAAAAGAAIATGAAIAVVATPTLANAAAAGGFGGCNVIPVAGGAVQFGFTLK